ncbi:hypothetical protein HHL22_01995 [Hymenobacter sp. RP-2-7]|uniref:HEAT repeat domain-containing protein n=1 Tax=Hymenobacter polaris TaxID=2682546 RepID=A0A7Y0AAU8_9BACT|nr:hypothetical protein [Hymenobacter polaris]NML63966.1 hypothetical protein [Hymenobacter polaris]
MSKLSPDLLVRAATYYDLAQTEQRAVLRDILIAADADPAGFVQQVEQEPFNELNNLPVFYEALAQGADRWSDFFLAEAQRLLAAASSVAEPAKVLTHLREFAFLSTTGFSHRRKLVALFGPILRHANPIFRFHAVQLLGEFVSSSDRVVMQDMQALQRDVNWRVRYVAYLTLLDVEGGAHVAALAWPDWLRAKFFQPFAIA